METKTPEQNGVRDQSSAQNAAGNLTYEQKVVRSHPGLDPVPGYVLAVFEKRGKGGAIFSRLVKSGERPPSIFRIPFLDWSQRYLSIAVNDSVLNYEFSHVITLDDGTDEFVLTFHLSYRVADPKRVAEMWEQDPLRQLRDEIGRVIARNCGKRKAEMFRDRFRELERIVIDGESAKLRAYAGTLGLKIISIDLDKPPLPDYQREVIQKEKKRPWEKRSHEIEQDVDLTKQKASREWEHQREKDDVDHKFDVQRLELRRQLELNSELDEVHRAQLRRKLREIEADAIGQALTHVSAGIDTPDALREGFEVAREISGAIQSDNGTSPFPTGLPSGTSAARLLDSGEDRLSSLLSLGMKEIDRWSCTFAQKQGLRSTLLHIVAEALLDDRADGTVLKQYANKLAEIGRGFQPPLNRNQRLFLDKFLNVDELKDQLR